MQIIVVKLAAILFVVSIFMVDSYTNSFVPIAMRKMSRLNPLAMATTDSKIDIVGRDIDLTLPLKERINSKIGKVIDKLGFGHVLSSQVSLRLHRYPVEQNHMTGTTKRDSQITEVTVFMKGGAVIRSTERTDDMYASIDLVAHSLAQKLKKHREKTNTKDNTPSVGEISAKMSEDASGNGVDISSIFNEEDLLVELDKKYASRRATIPPVDMSIVKPKKFQMPPISLEEAVLCLYYIDHDFYVFRNKESSEINVIYKRKDGTVGHIQPEK